MPARPALNHPKRRLLLFVAQDLDERIRSNTRDFLLGLRSLRSWLNGPPRFVNSREEPQDSSRGDMPIETLGGYIEIYSGLPPWTLPRDMDLQQLDEVAALIEAVRHFSSEQNLVLEFELDGELIGSIQSGKIDRSLAEGLLGEWKRNLGI